MSARAVFLVPHPDHAEALLTEGACGARVPVVIHGVPTGESGARWYSSVDNYHFWHRDKPKALVLAWDGLPADAGLDRWWRVGKAHDARWPYRHPTAWADRIEEVARIEARGLGTIVILPIPPATAGNGRVRSETS